MLIQMSCPWCHEDLAVEDGELQREIRCDECAVAFSFAPDGADGGALADAA
jgi:hypothetical protein